MPINLSNCICRKNAQIAVQPPGKAISLLLESNLALNVPMVTNASCVAIEMLYAIRNWVLAT